MRIVGFVVVVGAIVRSSSVVQVGGGEGRVVAGLVAGAGGGIKDGCRMSARRGKARQATQRQNGKERR
jgi:hypothetical protein